MESVQKIYVKCIKIDKVKHRYVLMNNKSEATEVGEKQLLKLMQTPNFHVINLDDRLAYKETGVVESYKRLSSDKIWCGSVSLYKKSILIGAAPEGVEYRSGEKLVVTKGTYDQLYLSDYTNMIEGDIEAQSITFVGEQSLVKHPFSGLVAVIIRCKRAVIKNKCIMNNLIPGMDVKLLANIVELRHKYINESTVFEVMELIKVNEFRQITDKLDLVYVHFNLYKLSIEEIYNNIKKIYYKLENNVHDSLDQLKKIKANTSKEEFRSRWSSYNVHLIIEIENWCALLIFLTSMHCSLRNVPKEFIDKQEELREMSNNAVDIIKQWSAEFVLDTTDASSAVKTTHETVKGRNIITYTLETYRDYFDKDINDIL